MLRIGTFNAACQRVVKISGDLCNLLCALLSGGESDSVFAGNVEDNAAKLIDVLACSDAVQESGETVLTNRVI